MDNLPQEYILQSRVYVSSPFVDGYYNEVNNELSYSQIMNRVPFKVPKGQISAIVKNKENIVSEHSPRRSMDHKKTLQPRHPEINEDVNQLVTWLRD